MTENNGVVQFQGKVPELISEKEVLERWPYFADKELRLARQKGLIGFYKRRKGNYYTKANIADYLERSRREAKPKRDAPEPKRLDRPKATRRPIDDMSPELRRDAANLLRRQLGERRPGRKK